MCYRPAESSNKLLKQWTAGVVGENTGLVLLTFRYIDHGHFVGVPTRHRHTDTLTDRQRERHTDRHTLTDTQTLAQTERERDKYKHTDRHTLADIDADRQTD